MLKNLTNAARKTGRFVKAAFMDTDLWVRGSATASGVVVAGEGIGIGFLLVTAAPVALAVVGVPLSAVLFSAGVYGVYNGAVGTWMRLHNLIADNFRDGKGHRDERPLKGFFENLRGRRAFRHPFFQKLFRSRFGKTQRQKNIVMSLLTIKGSVFSMLASGAIIVAAVSTGVGALPGIIIPALWAATEAIQLYHGTRLLVRSLKQKTPPEASEDMPEAAVPAPVDDNLAAKPGLSGPGLTPTFEQKSKPAKHSVVKKPPVPPAPPAAFRP